MKTTKCPNCKSTDVTLKTAIINSQIIDGCEHCFKTLQGNIYAAKYNRDWQKKEYRRELTQPNQKEYFKAYPDKAREQYGDDMVRQFG